MSWPTDTEQTLKHRTTSLQDHANKLLGMQGQGPAYSIFHNFRNGNATKPSPKPAPEQARPKPRPRPEGAGITARQAKRPKQAPKVGPVPPLPEPQAKPRPQGCRFFTVVERNTMHPEWPDSAEVQGVFGATLKGGPKQFVWFRGRIKCRLATPGKHRNLRLKIALQALPEWGEKAKIQNFEIWDDRPFPECPVQLRTPTTQVPPGNVWTGDVSQAWLEGPNIPEEQRWTINLKLRLGQ